MDAFAVKAEPIDVSLECENPVDDMGPSTKRRRMVMVVVPTLQEVNQNRAAKLGHKEESKVPQGKKIKNQGPKIKKNAREFDLDTINRRLDALGPDRDYEVNVPDEIKFTAVPRRFLSDTWGGGTQKTYPTVRREMLLKHGLDDWQYPNSEYNPHCPQVPGCAGLMFSPDGLNGPGDGEASEIMRTVVRLKTEPLWQYVGQYITIPAASLTKEEWLDQDSKVKNTWAKEIWRKGWGWDVRVRVTLRKRLHREPTYGELQKAYQDLENKYQNITSDDIRTAYDRGEELLGVQLLKCVGYDEAFQREIHEKIQTWVPPPPPEKKGSKGKEAKGRDTGNLKRKRSEEDTTDGSDGEVSRTDDAEEEEAGHVVYVPKGTKSRPKN